MNSKLPRTLSRVLLLIVAASLIFNAVCGVKGELLVNDSAPFFLLEEVSEGECEESCDSQFVVPALAVLPVMNGRGILDFEDGHIGNSGRYINAHLWRGPPVRNMLFVCS